MLGLLKYNYHSSWSSVLLSFILYLTVLFLVVIIQSSLMFSLAVSLSSMMFSFCIFSTSDHVDTSTLWASFEFLLPIEKKKIILARYITFLVFLLMGVVLGGIIVWLQSVLQPALPLHTLLLDMFLGVGFGLGFGATLMVETSASKSGGNQGISGLVFLVAPFLILITVVWGVAKLYEVSFIQLFLDKSIYTVALSIFVPTNILLWLISYPVSVKLYKTKEF